MIAASLRVTPRRVWEKIAAPVLGRVSGASRALHPTLAGGVCERKMVIPSEINAVGLRLHVVVPFLAPAVLFCGEKSMKCQLQLQPKCKNAVNLEFDRLVPPLFPTPLGMPRRIKTPDCGRELFWSSPKGRDRWAARIAKVNFGKFPFELSQPVRTYRELLEAMADVEGLIDVFDIDRYTMGVVVGGMFDLAAVARRVAELVQQSFYPEEPLELGRGFESPAAAPTLGAAQGSATPPEVLPAPPETRRSRQQP